MKQTALGAHRSGAEQAKGCQGSGWEHAGVKQHGGSCQRHMGVEQWWWGQGDNGGGGTTVVEAVRWGNSGGGGMTVVEAVR